MRQDLNLHLRGLEPRALPLSYASWWGRMFAKHRPPSFDGALL